MQIAIDIGNTRTKLSLKDEKGQQMPIMVEREPNKELLNKLLALHINRGIISSVGRDIGNWQELLPDIKWLVLDHTTPVSFTNKYTTPTTLGLDRIALAAAAANIFAGKNTLVIDAGTCVTYDFVDRETNYWGGSISPGLSMRLKAMATFTSLLPQIEVTPNANLIGDSTETCMQSGALNGLVAEIEGIIDRYAEQFQDLHTVVTGGDVKTLAPLVKNNIFARPNFLLEGLHGILAFNTP
jgi:type III pantothenate kinase